ncbi:leucine-rich repeat domain-containing protein [Chamaesiphon sp. VAR_48_metabat_403]|uniref:leucine-rich repeat domain-containing protein n=1 Tax=Chamaesiphon sp. VAR_48_metabat_403 TaxID=2964700 RepID=UPI00286E3C6A|nr:leucine-rich repeat domain-containing protein [Chamaesiphon sp. VAR_48_metabat_403]
MEQAELAQIIEAARRDRSTKLDLQSCELTMLPKNIGNLANLTSLNLYGNKLTILPESIGNLSNLVELSLGTNQLNSLPKNICKLTNLTSLVLSRNQLTTLPENISNLANLTRLYLVDNLLTSLPDSISNLSNLTELYLNDNPWLDLSNLHNIPNLKRVYYFGVNLSRRYWTHRSQWKAEWLLNENNADIRHALIEQIGFEKIIDNLALFTLDRLQKESINGTSKFELNLEYNRLEILPDSIGKLNCLSAIDLNHNQLTSLPKDIGNLSSLTELNLAYNQLTSLPKSIGNFSSLTSLYLECNQLVNLPVNIVNLSNLTRLGLGNNQLTSLPERIGKLSNLTTLNLSDNQLTSLPKSINNLTDLTSLDLDRNQLTDLPDNIGDLSNLTTLNLSDNQLTSLPKSIENLTNLTWLNLDKNPWLDLSSLQNIPNLKKVYCFNVKRLPRRYWAKLSEWKPEWLLDEDNAEIRRVLIENVGYENICAELNATTLDTWREYTLLKIDGLGRIYNGGIESIETEPMILLKMTCPSTAHIHILRVPPEMSSAEAAIVWVNHDIHPDDFEVQT